VGAPYKRDGLRQNDLQWTTSKGASIETECGDLIDTSLCTLSLLSTRDCRLISSVFYDRVAFSSRSVLGPIQSDRS